MGLSVCVSGLWVYVCLFRGRFVCICKCVWWLLVGVFVCVFIWWQVCVYKCVWWLLVGMSVCVW